MSIRFEVYEKATGEPICTIPYVHPGRALERQVWLNLVEEPMKYWIRPVKWREIS